MAKVDRPVVDLGCCTRCGLCIPACPCHAVEMTEEGIVFSCPDHCPRRDVSRLKDCAGWCSCADACPQDAIDSAFEIVLEQGSAAENALLAPDETLSTDDVASADRELVSIDEATSLNPDAASLDSAKL